MVDFCIAVGRFKVVVEPICTDQLNAIIFLTWIHAILLNSLLRESLNKWEYRQEYPTDYSIDKGQITVKQHNNELLFAYIYITYLFILSLTPANSNLKHAKYCLLLLALLTSV